MLNNELLYPPKPPRRLNFRKESHGSATTLVNALHVAKNFRMRDGYAIMFHNLRRRLLLGTLVCLLFFSILLGACFHRAWAVTDGDDNGYSQISIFAKAVQLIR